MSAPAESAPRQSLALPVRPRRASWLNRALPVLVLMVLLNLAMNIVQTSLDFGSLNEQAARRLDTLATSIALRIQDRARAVDLTSLSVINAIDTQTLSDRKLAQIASQYRDVLGDVSIAVLDPSGRMLAASDQARDLRESWLSVLHNETVARSAAYAQPVHDDSRRGLLFVKTHRSEAGAPDARIAVVIPLDQGLMKGVDLRPGSAALLRNHDDRVIARYPAVPALDPGNVDRSDGAKHPGPTASTWYAVSRYDGVNRLETKRNIAIGSSNDIWNLDLGYAVDEYRLPWQRSLSINLLGMAVQVALLVAGIVMLRREKRLHEEVDSWATLVTTVISGMPTPIALVDANTGKIRLANEALVSLFGVWAAAGEHFSALYADPSDWTDMAVHDAGEPVAMSTCTGPVDMVVRCSRLPGQDSGKPDFGTLLVTLTDVSQQCEQIRQLRTEADFDTLTKLPNRRHFARASERAVAHAQQSQSPLCVLAVDIDHFKRVNDTWGHAVGDRVLEAVADRFSGALRDQDLAARVGGEEFAAILQGASSEQAEAIAERIRLAVAGAPIVVGDGTTVRVTVSLGLAKYCAGEPDLSAAQARADAALYRAKNSGRNRVAADFDIAAEAAQA
nr:diguanylate cyclase [Paraburkholderia unamae]